MERANKRKKDEKKKEAWAKYWLPILRHLSSLCVDTRPDVRTIAMTHLQRAFLSPYLGILTPQGWFVCFEEAVFPLLSELLQPQEIDSVSLDEIRHRASGLLCRVSLLFFIHSNSSFLLLLLLLLF